jgi:hypothetical protein
MDKEATMKRILDTTYLGFSFQNKLRCKVDNLYFTFRLWIAKHILEKYFDLCWARLVMWAYGYDDFDWQKKDGCGYCNPECKQSKN